MKVSKEFRNGVFVIIAAAMLVVGYKYLTGINMFKPNREYVIYYPEVRGLKPSNPIMYKGVQIGLVKDIQFSGANYDSVKVTVMIDHDQFRMKEQTHARLASDGFLGGRKIDLEFGDTSLPFAKMGDVLVPFIEKDLEELVNEQVAPLKKKAEDLIATIDSVVSTITAFWDENTSKNITESVASVRRAVLSFEKTAVNINGLVETERARLKQIIKNVVSISQNLSDNNENITNAMKNISTFSDELKTVRIKKTLQMAEDAFTKFNLIIAKINSGEGTIGNLIYKDSLHDALLETNAYVQLLVDDLRNYPNRYLHFSIFGSREKGVKLSKDEEKVLKKLLDIQKSGNGSLRTFTNEEMQLLIDKVFN